MSLKPAPLPPKDFLRSFWLYEPSALANHCTTTELPKDADVVIVGSGVSGTLTAYTLLSKQPDLRIVILEAREVCSGATGRNGGQIKTDPYIAYPGLKARFGAEQANQVLKFESSHLDRFQKLLDKEKIPCDFQITTAYDVCLNPEMAKIGKDAFDDRKADWPDDMSDFLEISNKEHLALLSQVKGAEWGCLYKVGSIHPYKLVNGLLNKCFEMGSFNLQTNTPVTALEHDGVWSVKTDRGTITAPKVVLCTNAYMSNLLPEFANRLFPLRGTCSALAIPPVQPLTTPTNERMRPLFTTYSLKREPHDYEYMISRQEEPNHIIVGGAETVSQHDETLTIGNADDTTLIPGTKEYFKAFMPKYFINYPEPESRLAHLWTGIMGFTHEGIPYCGPVLDRPDGLYMLGGFSGRGMVRAYGTVQALVELLLAETDDPLKTLVDAGLPEAFLLSRERFESPIDSASRPSRREVDVGSE